MEATSELLESACRCGPAVQPSRSAAPDPASPESDASSVEERISSWENLASAAKRGEEEMRESQAATKRGADMASFAEEETPSELGAPKAPTELDLATQRGADVAAWAEEESVARAEGDEARAEGDEQDWERLLATNELKEAAAAVLKARAADSDCESFVSISNDGRVKDGVWAADRPWNFEIME
ncbi:hypothetical protein TeGR_g2075 [Tetraparma gracilis]|uniref:Uncharacterized protein n=1 Tax=Tetraparma gracilis TaxID=2962635 RepID=A0ABQ6N906_9STRA|nr:hypothetical protein TeGR_g2075 [Tetraparma gracilis]